MDKDVENCPNVTFIVMIDRLWHRCLVAFAPFQRPTRPRCPVEGGDTQMTEEAATKLNFGSGSVFRFLTDCLV